MGNHQFDRFTMHILLGSCLKTKVRNKVKNRVFQFNCAFSIVHQTIFKSIQLREVQNLKDSIQQNWKETISLKKTYFIELGIINV